MSIGPRQTDTDTGHEPYAASGREIDPLEGLPDDLVRALRDPSVIVPQDQAVFELIAKMTYAPATAASAMTNEQWMRAWIAEWQRANRAEVELEELRAANADRDSQMKKADDA